METPQQEQARVLKLSRSEIQNPTKTTQTTTKDHSYITKLPTFADRGTAIAKRLEEVKSNPKYQALSEEHKTRVRADLYKKYVPASYSGFHLPIPDEKTWVEATGRSTEIRDYDHHTKSPTQKLSDSYHNNSSKEQAQDFAVGASKALDQIDLFGTKVATKAFMAVHGLSEYLFHHNDSITNGVAEQREVDRFKKTAAMRALQNHKNSVEAKVQSADFWLETHPRSTMLGKLASMTGETVATLPVYEALGLEKAGGSVTARLAKSPVGQFVAKRILNATDGFLSTLVTSGGDKKAAEKGAAGFAAFAALSEAGGKLVKIASAPLIKKWTANTIAMGGKPLAQEVANSAMAEVEHEVGLEAHEGEAIAQVKRSEQVKDFMQDVKDKAAARTEMVQAWKKRVEDRAKFDPIMHKLHEGEKVSLNSIAVAQYGKNLNALSKNQRALVLAKRMELIEQAAVEAPVHLPDLHKDEVEHNIQEARKASPVMNSLMSELEGMGVRFADAVEDNTSTQIARETGISNVGAAAKKVGKVAKEVEPRGEITPKAFASLNSESVVALRAPRNRTQFREAISDKSKEGTNKFIDLIKQHVPAGIKFEDPAHMMLYMFGNRSELNKTSAGESVSRMLKYRLNQTKGWEGYTTHELDIAAKHLHNHLYDMARSGHLVEEGNIYRSTQLSGPMSWTKWQAPLSNEADASIISLTEKALKQHPAALRSFRTIVKTLQSNRGNYNTPEEYAAYKKALSEASSTILSHATTGDAIIFNK